MTDGESYSPAVLWKPNTFQSMEWQVEGIRHLLPKFILFGTSVPFTSQSDVIQLETQDLSQQPLAGAGIPSLGVVAKHQGWNPSGEEHFRRSNITPGWISKTAGWNDQKQQKCDSRVKIHRGQVPEAHWKAFLPPAEQLKAKGPWKPIEICNRNWPRGAYSANAGVEQEFW